MDAATTLNNVLYASVVALPLSFLALIPTNDMDRSVRIVYGVVLVLFTVFLLLMVNYVVTHRKTDWLATKVQHIFKGEHRNAFICFIWLCSIIGIVLLGIRLLI